MAERMTRAAREAAGKAAIAARLRDIACGAYGGYTPLEFDAEEFTGLMSELGPDGFGRFVGAVKNVFLTESTQHLTEARYLDQYDGLDTLAELLWRHGVRA